LLHFCADPCGSFPRANRVAFLTQIAHNKLITAEFTVSYQALQRNIHMKTGVLHRFTAGRMICTLILMAQFQLWDGVITQFFVGSGLARESNILMASMVYSGTFIAVKLLGLMLLIPALWVIYKKFPELALAATSSVTIFYCAVITWNFLTLFSSAL
jgi:hypothetical protein